MEPRETAVMEISEIRRANLALVQAQYGTATALAQVLDINPTQLSHIKNGKIGKRIFKLGDRLARKFELKLGLPAGWFDIHQGAVPAPPVVTPVARSAPSSTAPGCSAIQLALVDTARRLTEAGLLGDTECLAILQGWNSLIAQLPVAKGAST